MESNLRQRRYLDQHSEVIPKVVTSIFLNGDFSALNPCRKLKLQRD